MVSFQTAPADRLEIEVASGTSDQKLAPPVAAEQRLRAAIRSNREPPTAVLLALSIWDRNIWRQPLRS